MQIMSNRIQLPDLKEYALNYLARYNNTEAGLVKLLRQKVNRWIKQIQKENDQDYDEILKKAYDKIDQIVNELKQNGGINDDRFIFSKMPSLIRAGCSKKQIQGRFIQKGINPSLIQSSLQEYHDDHLELLSALAYARKRKIGPFRQRLLKKTAELKDREQMILARRGFSFTISKEVLSMTHAEAEECINKIRSL